MTEVPLYPTRDEGLPPYHINTLAGAVNVRFRFVKPLHFS